MSRLFHLKWRHIRKSQTNKKIISPQGSLNIGIKFNSSASNSCKIFHSVFYFWVYIVYSWKWRDTRKPGRERTDENRYLPALSSFSGPNIIQNISILEVASFKILFLPDSLTAKCDFQLLFLNQKAQKEVAPHQVPTSYSALPSVAIQMSDWSHPIISVFHHPL